MHLLLAQKGSINESDEAVDLGQTPGDIIFLSAADTELSSLADAAKNRGDTAPNLRLANTMQLSHPMSIDVYANDIIANAKLVIVRLLGGKSYWSYGVETLFAVAAENDVKLVFLPGDDKPDLELIEASNLEPEICNQLWSYLLEGGPKNADLFLQYCKYLIDDRDGEGNTPQAPVQLLKAGIWYPEIGICSLDQVQAKWTENQPVVAINFYRALVQSGSLQPIEKLVQALTQKGVNVLPVFISSLKDEVSVETVRGLFRQTNPLVVLNTTGFAVSPAIGRHKGTVLEEGGAVILQAVLSGGSLEAWQDSSQGLSAKDLAMNVALPEVDGRVLGRAIAFKNASNFDEQTQTNIVRHEAELSRIEYVAELAANWLKLATTKAKARKVAIVLANYPNRDGRLGNGVGLDTPAGTVNVLNTLKQNGYHLLDYPNNGDDLIRHLQEGPTNAGNDGRVVRVSISMSHYNDFFKTLPVKIQDEVTAKWGAPNKDPYFIADTKSFALPIAQFGNVCVGIQPARGYNIDPTETYHSPDLVPPHGYFAFYAWLRNHNKSHAIIHMGKHGNLEWLPGKALALSETCYPEAVMGPLPHLYPFIVNDPGEGSQAKRRMSAVIIDHLTPPLTRAESYGPLRDLEALVDEYYEASGNDPRRLVLLKKQILELIADIGLDIDAGIQKSDDENQKLEKLDGYLCELKEMQIRDGLHIFGSSPEGNLLHDLTCALVRIPRGDGIGKNQSLQRAIALDLDLSFDPLDCDMSKPWDGNKPKCLDIVEGAWRSFGDTVERIEMLSLALIRDERKCENNWQNTRQVLEHIFADLMPKVEACGTAEIDGILDGLNGKFVKPGPSGAPTRGRDDVLPTGRNFFSVDSRSVPTKAAWELGQKSAELLIARYRQDEGEWPTSFGLSAWGTSNMRTGGDDIAQAMALIGAKPIWDNMSRRVTGYEIITLAELGRPRIDVTLRISGFFRDAFPAQIELFDKAIRAIGALEEPEEDNPIMQRMRVESEKLATAGMSADEAMHKAGFRIFGSKPGAYGAGLQALIDEKGWDKKEDLANAYLAWGGYAYGAKDEGTKEHEAFVERLSGIEAVIHNQDNREHDLLDSDDYYQFEGGMSAAIEHVSGAQPNIYHNDHSRPEKPVVRALEEEIARVVRARVVNPKWIKGVMRHGYKGAFEMAATLDYLFAFSATTGAVQNHHFEMVYDAFLADEEVLDFLKEKNPEALREMADRFLEAEARELWTPRSNSAKFALEKLAEMDNASIEGEA